MKQKLANEPVVIRAAIVAAVTAIVHVGVVLGLLDLTPEQEDVIGTAVDLAGAAIAVVWSRQGVSPAPTYTPRHSASAEPSEAVSVDESAPVEVEFPVEDVESIGHDA